MFAELPDLERVNTMKMNLKECGIKAVPDFERKPAMMLRKCQKFQGPDRKPSNIFVKHYILVT